MDLPISIRDRLALISGVDLEQLDGLEPEDGLQEIEPNLARLVTLSLYFFSYIISFSFNFRHL